MMPPAPQDQREEPRVYPLTDQHLKRGTKSWTKKGDNASKYSHTSKHCEYIGALNLFRYRLVLHENVPIILHESTHQ